MQIFDISRPISPSLAVWPGDAPYSAQPVMRIRDGDSVNLSTLTMSAHTGTHADAPYHFDDDAPTIAALPLDVYIGPATVVELPISGAILPEHLAALDLDHVERLLVKTHSSQQPDSVWNEAIAFLDPATADLLGRHGVRLFGTDAQSVDPLDSQSLAAHHALHRAGVAILENLQLCAILPGDYELIALPLNIPADGCPVRAVLRRA